MGRWQEKIKKTLGMTLTTPTSETPDSVVSTPPTYFLKKSQETIALKCIHHTIAKNYGLSINELEIAAAQDWEDIQGDPEKVEALADAIAKQNALKIGRIPSNYTAKTNCTNCGSVPIPPELTNGGNVLGCPWCHVGGYKTQT